MIVFFVKVKVSKLLIFAVNNKAANLYIIYKCDYICASLYFFLMFSRILTYIIHSGFISGYQNRYGDNLKPPTNVYHRMTA